MRLVLFTVLLFLNLLVFGQIEALNHASSWKLYRIMDENAFAYRLDTLNHFSYRVLNQDSIKYFMSDLSELSHNSPQIWQGAYIATFEINGIINKMEISHFGGLLYDETRKRHYQIAESKIDAWLAYIRQSFMAIKNDNAGD